MALFKRVPFHKRLKAMLEAAEEHGYHVTSVEQDHAGYPIVMDREGKRIGLVGPTLKRKMSKEQALKVANHIHKVHTPIPEDMPGEGFFRVQTERRGGVQGKTEKVINAAKKTLNQCLGSSAGGAADL